MNRRLLGAVGLITLAVLAFLLAADVRSWRTAIATGDTVYAGRAKSADWTPRATVGDVAGSLLGTDDDLTIRRALQLYSIAATAHLRLDNATRVQTARAAAQDALTAAAATAGAKRSSQARTLLGILTFGSSAAGGEQDQIDSAVADFADAIRADPQNDDAKFDLELLLRLSAASGTRPGQGLGGSTGPGGHRGAGGGTPGKGY